MIKKRAFSGFLALSFSIVLLLSACGGGGGDLISYLNVPAGGSGDGSLLNWFFDLTLSDEIKLDTDPFDDIDSSPAIGTDGTIYIGSLSRYLYAINPDGSLRWSYETGGAIDGSPAIGSDGTVYAGSADRQVYAINPDGTLKWAFPSASVFTSSPAIGSDGTIYIGGTNHDRLVYVCPDDNKSEVVGYLYAINPDGSLKWQVILSGAVHSSPAIASDGTIYIGSDGDNDDLSFDRTNQCDEDSVIPPSDAYSLLPVNGHLYAINANGTLKWDFRALGDVDSSPAIGSDGTIYVGSDAYDFSYGTDTTKYVALNPSVEGYLYAINANGTLKWLFYTYGDVDSSPAIGSDGTIYVGSDKNDLFAINPDGTMKWNFPARGDINSSPAIASDGTIYFGADSEFDDDLYAINPDGTEKWRYDTGGFVNSSPAIGSNGAVYFGSEDGFLYSVNGSSGLANSPWPKFHRDLINNGRSY